jgi:hypothetical protein
MSKEQIQQVRKKNNDIDVQYLFEKNVEANLSDNYIENPIETFEQAFRV